MSKPFVVAAKQVFGLKDGETLTEFKRECDELTMKDCEDLAPLLAKEIGEEVTLPNRTPQK